MNVLDRKKFTESQRFLWYIEELTFLIKETFKKIFLRILDKIKLLELPPI